jgi:hypothetical protein
LADCRSNFCGRVNCLEGCCFGTYRRLLAAIPAIHDLLQKCNTPLFEVRIGRGVWVRPFRKLQEASIEAAKQLNRRALDSLHDTRIVAVGAFKVAPAVPPLDHDERWRCEIHQIVSGVKKEDLERIFSTRRDRGEIRSTAGKVLNHLMITEIHELGPTISEVIRQDLRGWRHPWQDELDPARPTKAHGGSFTDGSSAWTRMRASFATAAINTFASWRRSPARFEQKSARRGHIHLGWRHFGSEVVLVRGWTSTRKRGEHVTLVIALRLHP